MVRHTHGDDVDSKEALKKIMEAQKDHIALLHENIPEVPLEFEKIKVDLIKVLNEQERDGIAQGILAGLKEKAVIVN